MALRRPTVRSRSAPRKHFGFFQFGLKVRFRERLGTIGGALRGVEEAAAHDASRPPVSAPFPVGHTTEPPVPALPPVPEAASAASLLVEHAGVPARQCDDHEMGEV